VTPLEWFPGQSWTMLTVHGNILIILLLSFAAWRISCMVEHPNIAQPLNVLHTWFALKPEELCNNMAPSKIHRIVIMKLMASFFSWLNRMCNIRTSPKLERKLHLPTISCTWHLLKSSIFFNDKHPLERLWKKILIKMPTMVLAQSCK